MTAQTNKEKLHTGAKNFNCTDIAQKLQAARTVLVIAGPTASGKSRLALDVAQKLDGEIINADSMQVYDGLRILTARPSETDTQTVPHHLYGYLDTTDSCSAGLWSTAAAQKICDIFDRGHIPVIAGGTGLYIHTLVQGLSPMPDIPAEIRSHTREQAKTTGTEQFYNELQDKDPALAAKLEKGDTQRILRGIEVLRASGKPLTYWQSLPPVKPLDDVGYFISCYKPDRQKLYDACNTRFEKMIEDGALVEVAALAEKLGDTTPAPALCHALGYKALKDYLANDITMHKACELAAQQTRRYAKRQLTWLRGQLKPHLVFDHRYKPQDSQTLLQKLAGF